MRMKKPRLLLALAVFLLLYVGSYAVLSRRGYAEADRYNMKGFYYLTPEKTVQWRFENSTCIYLYLPLNVADQWLGTGRSPASEPLWGLSR
jgi:hypothetical protein